MINNNMNDDKSQNDSQKSQISREAKPNENSGVYFSSHVKIFDPNTNEVLVQKRGDE